MFSQTRLMADSGFRPALVVALTLAIVLLLAGAAAAACVVPDSGGTAELPPGGCDYSGTAPGVQTTST